VRNALTGHGECQSFNCDAGLAPTCRGNNPPEIGAIPARRFCSAGPAITFATLVPCADNDPGRAGDYHVAASTRTLPQTIGTLRGNSALRPENMVDAR
jgi:hypothetical protein